MPWQEVSTMSLRHQFVMLARQAETNVAELCRRFAVSRKTGYKWLRRHAQAGAEGLSDVSRRPRHSPKQNALGRLQVLGQAQVPAASTINAILKRHGLLGPTQSSKHRTFQRYERPAPNALWQMDFKGHFALGAVRCHPLTVLDDHSRYSICLRACLDETTATVQQALTESFRRYGLPDILMDNGSPWGNTAEQVLTPLTVWLIRLAIRARYQPSARAFPKQIPDIEYAPGDIVRKVQDHGALYFRGRVFRISKALRGYPVALRPTTTDGQFDVSFCHHKVAQIDFHHPYE